MPATRDLVLYFMQPTEEGNCGHCNDSEKTQVQIDGGAPARRGIAAATRKQEATPLA